MTESSLRLSEIEDFLKRAGLHLKVKNINLDGTEESLTFNDTNNNVQVCGKIVTSFTEGEVYHWPLINHNNLAPLIDILDIRNDLCIYLTIDHQLTLKNIVHDEDFVYDPRGFNRKRSYAKDIFSGLSYLHERSLSLMNLSDDNIIISIIDDRAIITNFKHLTSSNKATRSQLHMPEMYMAPETEKGEFDTMKAEIWASGIMMLDIFLAHMVPWPVIDYDPKKIMQIVDNLSLELLQAANAGSDVSIIDLSKFQMFLKCFFKINPVARIPAKNASITSFLQYNKEDLSETSFLNTLPDNLPETIAYLHQATENFTLCNIRVSNSSHQKEAFVKDVLPSAHADKSLSEKDLRICLKEKSDSSFHHRESPKAENTSYREILGVGTSPDVLLINKEQIIQPEMLFDNEREVGTTLSETSAISNKQQKGDNLTKTNSSSFYKNFEPSFDEETTNDYYNKNPLDKTFRISLNQQCDSNCFKNAISKGEINQFTSIAPLYDVSSVKSQEATTTEISVDNEEEIDVINMVNSFSIHKPLSEDNSTENHLPSIYEVVDAGIYDEEPIKFQKTTQSCEIFNEDIKSTSKSSLNCCHSKSLSFVKSKKWDDNAAAFQLQSRRNYCLTKKFATPKQSVDLENSDICLNRLFGDSNSAESNSVNKEATNKFSEIVKAHPVQNESEVKQHISYKNKCSISTQTSMEYICKKSRFSGATPHFFINPEVKSVIDKIVFLRKCYMCIQEHQRMFISKEFAWRQQKFISEYQILMHRENLRLRDLLSRKYGLKIEDVTKLLAFQNLKTLRNEYLYQQSMNNQNSIHRNKVMQVKQMQKTSQNLMNTHNLIHWNKVMEIQKRKGALNTSAIKHNIDGTSKNKKSVNIKPCRNYSYYKAIENSEKYFDKIWEVITISDGEKSNKEREKTVLVPEKLYKKFVSASTNDKIIIDERFDAEMPEELKKRYEKDINDQTKVSDDLNEENSECLDKSKKKDKKKKDKKTIDNKKKVKVESSTKKRNKTKKKEKSDKMIYEKFNGESKKPFFASLCPGGKID